MEFMGACMAYKLLDNLNRSEMRAGREGWIDADDIEKELGVLESAEYRQEETK